MKITKSGKTYNNNNLVTKDLYYIVIDGELYPTTASSERLAISNAAFRHSKRVKETVQLIRWKMNTGEIDWYVKDGADE